jgi:hypothetical protein
MISSRFNHRHRPLVLALLLATTTILAIVVQQSGTSQLARAEIDNTTALLTTNRTSLKVCVQPLIPDITAAESQVLVQQALARIARHPDFIRAGLGGKPVTVDIGCPGTATIDNPRFEATNKLGVPAEVTTPSQYRAFVYIASPERLIHSFGENSPRTLTRERPLRTTAQELLCDGDTCGEVTVAAYMSPEELRTMPLLDYVVTHAIGLWPVDESPADAPASIDPRGK